MTIYIAAMGGLQVYIFRQLFWWTAIVVVRLQVAILSIKSAGEHMPWLAGVMLSLPVSAIVAAGFVPPTGWRPRKRGPAMEW